MAFQKPYVHFPPQLDIEWLVPDATMLLLDSDLPS